MQYVRCLLAYGDQCFTQNTRESIAQALGYYLAIADLLGATPRALLSATYDDRQQHRRLSELIPATSFASTVPASAPQAAVIFPYNYIVASYFHVPENREFMSLWTDVADRLFKIRNCQSIAGIRQQLALYSPAIDPHQLVRAVASRGGEFVNEMVAELSGSNRPLYRFLVLLNKAKELASFVERIGDSLLSMLGQQDAAGLNKLNNDHAQELLAMVTQQKKAQISLAESDNALLVKRQESIQARVNYYSDLTVNNGMSPLEIALEPLHFANTAQEVLVKSVESVAHMLGGVAEVGSPFAMVYGGRELCHLVAAGSVSLDTVNILTKAAIGGLERGANYERRYKDWLFQLTAAQADMEELKLQQAAAQLHVDVSKQDLDQHLASIAQQAKLTSYYNTQFTNSDLFGWYADQLYDLLSNAYQLALRVAKQAALAYQYELGVAPNVSLTGFWVSSRKGLLSGQKLSYQLQLMEQSYLDYNARVPEIEKVLSLRAIYESKNQPKTWTANAVKELLDPNVGIRFTLDESLFQDFSLVASKTPGSTLVIKTVSVNVPALAGPYRQVNLVLTHTPSGDQICISRGTAATGMFSTSLEDARYLPFEGRTLDQNSAWVLTVGGTTSGTSYADLYNSISDIQLTVFYMIIAPISNK
jgi:hypothetical protein